MDLDSGNEAAVQYNLFFLCLANKVLREQPKNQKSKIRTASVFLYRW